MMHKLIGIVCVAMCLASGTAYAQNIGVTVDGEEVAFSGTRPMSVEGRVLVPLRGVLEKMGAFVEWVPKTRTVVAQKGDTYVELPVGSRTATINGRTVTLDVPAAVMAGSTMVPLRFLGEALGADVKWMGETRRVAISTGPTAVVPPGHVPVSAELNIASFSHNAKGWLKGGDKLQVVLQGTTGGQAEFEIPGVVEQIKLQETSNGRYTGSWTVPQDATLTVSGASVIGLLRLGQRERLIQAGDPLSIDTVAPKIRSMTPEPGTAVGQTQPSISAVLEEQTGSGVDVKGVSIKVNGKDVTTQATVTKDFVSYRPSAPLPSGTNSVVLSVRDAAGNDTSESWSFEARAVADVIKSFSHSNLDNILPGDVIAISMQAEAEGSAGFSIVRNDEKLRTEEMQETSPGNYAGEYTVRRNDNLDGATIVGFITTKSGHVYTTQSKAPIGGLPLALAPPRITSPEEGSALTSPVVISGTAAPNARVRLRLDYETMLLGAFAVNGVLSEQTVEVSEIGSFSSEPLSLGTLVKGKGTKYTLTAVTVGPKGEESEPVIMTFQRS